MTTPMTRPNTGLPPGVATGPLGRRFVAYLIDHALPIVLVAVASSIALGTTVNGRGRTVILIATIVLSLVWGIVVWRMYAIGAAGPGMRVMRLQLVGYRDGRPIGWGRFLLRWLVLTLLSATVLGLLIMIISMVVQARRQGWHDLAADSVVIVERVLAPRPAVTSSAASAPSADTSSSAASADTAGSAASAASAPEPTAAEEAASAPAATAELSERAPRPMMPTEWVLIFDDGWDLAVEDLVLLGRNPSPEPGEEDAQLIKIADTTRTVSKTHLAVGVDSNGLYVMDRGSTNGSTVTTPDGFSVRCTPGDVTPVGEETIVSFGDHWFRVTHL